MKSKKAPLLFLVTLVFGVSSLAAENWIHEKYADFGITSIGIYTNGYRDERTSGIDYDYERAAKYKDVRYFRNTLANMYKVTPPATTLDYPLEDKGELGWYKNLNVDEPLQAEVSRRLEALEWSPEIIEGFSGGTVKQLLNHAKKQGLDAVLLVRYYPVDYFVPFSNYRYSEDYQGDMVTATWTANIGKLRKGLMVIPAFELYDTETGFKLWYGLHYTGNPKDNVKENYQKYVDQAYEIFVAGDNPEAKAISGAVSLSLDSMPFFPRASDSGAERDDALASSLASDERKENLFWTDHPFYSMYFRSNIGLEYRAEISPGIEFIDYDNTGDEVLDSFSVEPFIMHKIYLILTNIKYRNLSMDSSFSFGFMPPIQVNQYVTENSSGFSIRDSEVIKFSSVGMKLRTKYHFMFTSTKSLFLGLGIEGELWSDSNTSDYRFDRAGIFSSRSGGMAFLNIEALAGFSFDTAKDNEIFVALNPFGLNGSTPIISVGIHLNLFDIIGAGSNLSHPHSTNCWPNITLFEKL